jgi:hypothetical protein
MVYSGTLSVVATIISLVGCVSGSPFLQRKGTTPAITLTRNGQSGNISSKTLHLESLGQVAKLHRSLDNYERNTKRALSGAPTIAERALMKRGDVSESLTPIDGGTWWSADVDVGTPPVRVRVDLDTGSTDFWVTSSNCAKCQASVEVGSHCVTRLRDAKIPCDVV